MSLAVIDSVDNLQAAVREATRLHPVAGRSKSALAAPRAGAAPLDLSSLTGVLEYDPKEFTFTARAGTPLSEIAGLLAESGQYLPFDPPFAEAGATLGGTVAAGLSGPGRNRYGGVRDFIIGVKFVDGTGRLVTGGGKVVKNAAGFDFPKLMVGSMGRLGIIVEASFKVFPAPKSMTTLSFELGTFAEALEALVKLSRSPLDLEALDLVPPATLQVRLGGLPEALPARVKRVESLLGRDVKVSNEGEDQQLWHDVLEMRFVPEGACLVKVPVTPKAIAALDPKLEDYGVARRYSAAGTLAWVAWPEAEDTFDAVLASFALGGLVLRGSTERVRLGATAGAPLLARVKRALDPAGKFPDL